MLNGLESKGVKETPCSPENWTLTKGVAGMITRSRNLLALLLLGLLCLPPSLAQDQQDAPDSRVRQKLQDDYDKSVRPLMTRLCLGCHSTKEKKGELDLERFTSLELISADVKPWQAMVEQLDTKEMPPKGKPQPTAAERTLLIRWVTRMLDAEARARAGDPGPIVLRRLSNAEYNYTVRDLTGITTLDPTREFPVDGAAGEGFTNAGAAQAMSPASSPM